jgi:sugar lactone lactonase YvrE
MLRSEHSRILSALLLCLLILSACGSAGSAIPSSSASPVHTPSPTSTASILPTASSTEVVARHYRSHLLLRGYGRPDDLALDAQGNLFFSDAHNGTINRLNRDGTVSVLARGLAAPEGLVVLQNGTIIIAEQRTNRLLLLLPGAQMPLVLRTLPGTPGSQPCKAGIDGIAFDRTTQTLIVPDSPTGEVYRMSLDGRTLQPLASGMVRPVGAAVDGAGNVYVADECGRAVWRISPNGHKTRFGGFGMPDDVAWDGHGNLLVIDLAPAVHALIRMQLATGQRETLASQGFIEPQGLVTDQHDHIYVADDYANMIVEFTPT